MISEELTYRLDLYEGPLDLLLSLIAKNKMDIRDIPIAEICEQYMAYVEEAQHMNLEIAGEFIVMASELMLIKSRLLLPASEDENEDPRAELVDALLLYKQAKQAAEELRPLYAQYSGRMQKEEDEIPPEKGFPLGLDPAVLSRALHTLLTRLRNEEQRAPANLINPLIKHRVVSVQRCIEHIMIAFDTNETASLFFLLKNAEDKAELVASFMGLLELIKLRRVLICDDEEYDPDGLTIRFRLNPDYDPEDIRESEFDNDARDDNERADDSGDKAEDADLAE